ncbi:DNA-binding transcriptional regulator, GntR family [Kaistia soli DSM 19436]|uniref:DNA-binding transcriptional regulator, GntR family n=1 Tax=Kaistia soli DSM 19436 TaxID=1122133 RepID=A0A1M5I223_9HYPH|nr:GntR family transcriptional regulator [Kaistia soli]SHG22305.1 DNA-binding transcriptional regulator, GntR family [Kaistia soli DSM 19436]
MARSRSVFKNSYNRLLDILAEKAVGDPLRSLTELGSDLHVSGSTIAQLVRQLEKCGLVAGQRRWRVIVRLPNASDYYPMGETRSATQHLEEQFLRSIIGGDAKEGDVINELQIARRFNTSTSSVREFLIRFSRFGLIEKRPNRSWILRGITTEFIDEVLTLREAFAGIAVRRLLLLPTADSVWAHLAELRIRLLAFIDKVEVGDREFQDLENETYGLMARASTNRFIVEFTELSLSIVYYNYRVDRAWEISENKAGARILVEMIEAIVLKDMQKSQELIKQWIERARYSYRYTLSSRAHTTHGDR